MELDSAEWMVLPSACSPALRQRIQEAAVQIADRVNRPIRVAAARPESGQLLLEIVTGVDGLGEQEFELKINTRECSLRAGGEPGAFYGSLAFRQVVEQFGERVPSLTLRDAPDFAARGIMLDVSRCKVPTMATCRQLVDRFAGMRINQLQLYTEHTFAFSAHDSVWRDASPFTHEEILELDQYCADRFIELVPNFNSFGHFGRWLRHPEYRHLAECPENPRSDCLAPNDDSIAFLEPLYDEYLPQFSSSLFNVGCDETWELGKGRSKARAEKTSITAVYLDFLQKLHSLVAKKGRRMQFWGDIILHESELIKQVPKDALALCWGYEADHPYDKECPAFADAGLEYYVCPGTSAWNSITGRSDNCLANLKNAASSGLKHGASGYLITDWGDGGHHQVLPISYLGYAAGAAYSWCLKANQAVDFAAVLNDQFFQDPSGVLGQFCIDLGRTLNRIPGLARRNSSAIHQLLFGNLRDGRPDLSQVSPAQFDDAEAWLLELEASLARARPECADRDLLRFELRHALAASRHALNRGRFVQFGQGSEDALRRELQRVVAGHEEQWLARNRRGGLYESSTRLRGTSAGAYTP